MIESTKDLINDVVSKTIDSVLVGGGVAAVVSEELMQEDFMGLHGWAKIILYSIAGVIGLLRIKSLWYEGNIKKQDAKIKETLFNSYKDIKNPMKEYGDFKEKSEAKKELLKKEEKNVSTK